MNDNETMKTIRKNVEKDHASDAFGSRVVGTAKLALGQVANEQSSQAWLEIHLQKEDPYVKAHGQYARDNETPETNDSITRIAGPRFSSRYHALATDQAKFLFDGHDKGKGTVKEWPQVQEKSTQHYIDYAITASQLAGLYSYINASEGRQYSYKKYNDVTFATHALKSVGLSAPEAGSNDADYGKVKESVKKYENKGNNGRLDISKMQFGKAAYVTDGKYQSLKKLMIDYNNHLDPKCEDALLDACVAYLEPLLTSKDVKHQGRINNVEGIIYELTMKGGTQKKAKRNLERFTNDYNSGGARQNSFKNSEDNPEKVLNTLEQVVDNKDGKYSPMMSAITSDVLSLQNKTNLSFGVTSDAEYLHGSDTYKVQARTEDAPSAKKTDFGEALATTMHEFTHVASGVSFKNDSMFITYEQGTSEKQMNEMKAHKVELMKSLNENATDGAKGYIKGRVEYALGNKASGMYAANMMQKLVTWLDPTYKITQALKYDDALALVNAKIATFAGNQATLDRVIKERDRIIALRNCEQVGDIEMDRQQQAQKQVWMNEKDENKRNALQKAYGEDIMNNKFVNPSSAHVENDSVVNQMLIRYEQEHPEDKSSQYYRTLKFAAIENHVARMKARHHR